MARVAIICAAFFAPFGVSGIFQNLIGPIPSTVLILAGVVLILAIKTLQDGKILLNAGVKTVALLFFAPVLLSIALGLPAGLLFDSPYITYYGYGEESIGRYINLFLLLVFFIAAGSFCVAGGESVQRKIILAYWVGCSIFVLFGIWQALNFYCGVPFPDLGTRTHIHSVPEALKTLVPGRLTSLANEPSFFAPIIIDFLLLSLLIINRRNIVVPVVIVSALLLFLTFSGGGYLNAFLLTVVLSVLVLMRAFARKRIKKKTLIIVGVVVMLMPWVAFLMGDYGRIVTERIPTIFDPEGHSRAFMVFMPLRWLLESNIINMLFGFGPKSYALIGNAVTLPSGVPVHVTSNNLFTDFAWETGLVGFCSITVLFVVLMRHLFKLTGLMSRERWIGCLLTFHLLFSSLYRGDFSSLRFWVLLLVIICLMCIRFPRSMPQHSNEVVDRKKGY